MDNQINIIFGRFYDQITNGPNNPSNIIFDRINNFTFRNGSIHILIAKLTNKSVDFVRDYLADNLFQQKFLFNRLKKRIHVAILLDQPLNELITKGYKIDYAALELIVLNNRLHMLKYLVEQKISMPKMQNDLLMYCSEYGHTEMYFYLRTWLVPNISIYNRAAQSSSLSIITDISKRIGVSAKIVSTALESNHTNIINLLLNEAKTDEIMLGRELLSYPILNCNFEVIEQFEKTGIADWYEELYHSALLSGSMQIVKLLENRFPLIHHDFLLDKSKVGKGITTLLLQDMVYESNGKNYFSHTMNYAIQSNSLEIVKYIHSLGYGLTASNFITAIRQASPEILQYLASVRQNLLPPFLLHYFGIDSYVIDKFAKARILHQAGLLNWSDPKTVDEFKKDSVHYEMICQQICTNDTGIYDPDYLLNYKQYFGNKQHNRLLTKIRIALELNLDNILEQLLQQISDSNRQSVVDTIYLFGSIDQIKKYYPIMNPRIGPSEYIITEIMIYGQLGKLSLIRPYMSATITKCLVNMATVLDDPLTIKFVEKICSVLHVKIIPEPKYVIASGKIPLIIEWLEQSNSNDLRGSIKNLLELDDISIVKKIIPKIRSKSNLAQWCEENDLREISAYLVAH